MLKFLESALASKMAGDYLLLGDSFVKRFLNYRKALGSHFWLLTTSDRWTLIIHH